MECKKLISCENLEFLQKIIDSTNSYGVGFELKDLYSFFLFSMEIVSLSNHDQHIIYESLLEDIKYYENNHKKLEKEYEKFTFKAIQRIFNEIFYHTNKESFIGLLYDIKTEYENNTGTSKSINKIKSLHFFEEIKVNILNCFYLAGSYLPSSIRRFILNVDLISIELCSKIELLEDYGISEMIDLYFRNYMPSIPISLCRKALYTLCQLKSKPIKTMTKVVSNYLNHELEEKSIKQKMLIEEMKVKEYEEEQSKILNELIETRKSSTNLKYRTIIDSEIKKLQMKYSKFSEFKTKLEQTIAKCKITFLQQNQLCVEKDFDDIRKELLTEEYMNFNLTDGTTINEERWGDKIKRFLSESLDIKNSHLKSIIPVKTIKKLIDNIPIIKDKNDIENQTILLGMMGSILLGPKFILHKTKVLKYNGLTALGYKFPGRPPKDIPFSMPTPLQIIPAGLLGLIGCSNLIEDAYLSVIVTKNNYNFLNEEKLINLNELESYTLEEEEKNDRKIDL
jgi:hypothetical protein